MAASIPPRHPQNRPRTRLERGRHRVLTRPDKARGNYTIAAAPNREYSG